MLDAGQTGKMLAQLEKEGFIVKKRTGYSIA
jgi:DNA-binding MarR family transcriptional regulator